MDDHRFDNLTRAFAAPRSRRQVLTGLAGGAAGGVLALVGRGRAEAQACRGPGRLCNSDGNCCSGICNEETRRCECPPGQVACRDACVDPASHQTDPNHCGGCGNRCPRPANATGASCNGGICGFGCAAGFHACGNVCVSDSSVATCGTSCSPCPVPPNATATCDGTACGFVCNQGFHDCGGTCVSNSSVDSCGTSCSPCPAPPANATATCDGTACGFNCDGGFHRCGDACLSNSSTESCGTSCTPCTPPANATATCDGQSCGFSCNAGYTVCGNLCDPAPPIPDTILGNQIAWLLAQINGGVATLTEEEFYQHFYDAADYEGTVAFLQVYVDFAPWEFAGYVGTPTDYSGTFTAVWTHSGRQPITLSLESTAPYRIVGFAFGEASSCP